MRKRYRKAGLQLLASLAAVLLAAGCSQKVPPVSESQSSRTASSTGEVFEPLATMDTQTTASAGETQKTQPPAKGTTAKTTKNNTPTPTANEQVDITDTSEKLYKSVSGVVRVPVFAKPDAMALARKKGFENKYNCTLQYEVYGWNEWKTSIINMVSAGNPPDLTPMFAHEQFLPYVIKGVVQSLDQYVDLKDPIWDKNITTIFMRSGKHYGMGGYNIGNTMFMYYNKKLLEAEGLDPMKEYKNGNWTWDTFRDFAARVTKDTDRNGTTDIYGLATSYWDAFCMETGGSGVALNANGTLRITLDSPGELAGMDFIRKMYNEDHSYTFTSWDTLWRSGKAGFIIDRAWNAVGIFDLYNTGGFKVGMVPIPKQSKSAKEYAPMILEAFGIPTGASNPLAAMAYLNYSVLFSQANEKTSIGLEQRRISMSDEHLAFAQEYLKNVPISYSFINGVGNWYDKQWTLWGELFDNNKTARSAVEIARGVLQNEINLLMS